MKLQHIETMDANDIDIKARELLAEELATGEITVPVIIWPDEENAYLDTSDQSVYTQLAHHFSRQYEEQVGVPSSSIASCTQEQLNDSLYNRYLVLFEDVEKELEKQTMQSGPVPDEPESSVLTWRRKDGWYGCLTGTYEGNYVESEDQGPYENRAEAEHAALGELD